MSPDRHILLVETNDEVRLRLEASAAAFAHVESHRRFETARKRLFETSFDLLVTNVRLDAYNGLHLVYLSSTYGERPRAIVYADTDDSGLAREVQRAGAFYERGRCVAVTLEAYLKATLPAEDRRGPSVFDRRLQFRGGRRSWDRHLSANARTG